MYWIWDWFLGQKISDDLPKLTGERAADVGRLLKFVPVEALVGEGDLLQIERADADSVIKSAYEHLNILDVKAGALLTFSGVMIAILGIHGVLEEDAAQRNSLLLIFGLLAAVLSAIFCHSVIYVFWTKNRGSQVVDEDILAAIDVVIRRTIRYRKAFSLSLASVLFVILFEASVWVERSTWNLAWEICSCFTVRILTFILLFLAFVVLAWVCISLFQRSTIRNFPSTSDIKISPFIIADRLNGPTSK